MKIQTLCLVETVQNRDGQDVKTLKIVASLLDAKKARRLLEEFENNEKEKAFKDRKYTPRQYLLQDHNVYGVSSKRAIKIWTQLEKARKLAKIAKQFEKIENKVD